MIAGLLTEPITILTSEITKNDFGEESVEWKEKYHTKARLIHDYGSRNEINGEIFYSSTKTFQVRSYVPVDYFDRVLWDSKVYRIIDLEPSKEQQNITIRTELVND